jgi:hypothetical protein
VIGSGGLEGPLVVVQERGEDPGAGAEPAEHCSLAQARAFGQRVHGQLARALPGEHLAGGSLTIRGRARPLSFGAKVSSAGGEVTLDGKVQVNRADLGLTWNRMGMVPVHNTITVHAVFTRQQARPPTPLAARPLQAAQRAPAALTSPAAPPIVLATVDSRSESSR